MRAKTSDIAILGAGPIGLEAALAAADAGMSFTVYEVGDGVGAHVRAWGHVSLFTPWDLDVSPRMADHLAAAGIKVPTGGDCPTGNELVERLLVPVATLPELAPHIRLNTRVEAVGRQGLLKHEQIATPERGERSFRLLLAHAGAEEVAFASAVLDCTGTYSQPNLLGDGGIPSPGERSLRRRIRRHLPDLEDERADWAGKTVLLVGAGASAQTAARELAALAEEVPSTRVIWSVRSSDPSWGAVTDDPLPGRAALVDSARILTASGSPAVQVRLGTAVAALGATPEGRIQVTLERLDTPFDPVGATNDSFAVDQVLALTGYVGDAGMYRQLQVHECYATAAPINLSAALLGAAAGNCLDQVGHGLDVLHNPEPNFYILGSKSYGRVNQFLLWVGWDQVSQVIGHLAERSAPAQAGAHSA
ncbi:MAG: FAD-dependent oxidoreductase [Candidatus Dormibacteria bacterium]